MSAAADQADQTHQADLRRCGAALAEAVLVAADLLELDLRVAGLAAALPLAPGFDLRAGSGCVRGAVIAASGSVTALLTACTN